MDVGDEKERMKQRGYRGRESDMREVRHSSSHVCWWGGRDRQRKERQGKKEKHTQKEADTEIKKQTARLKEKQNRRTDTQTHRHA